MIRRLLTSVVFFLTACSRIETKVIEHKVEPATVSTNAESAISGPGSVDWVQFMSSRGRHFPPHGSDTNAISFDTAMSICTEIRDNGFSLVPVLQRVGLPESYGHFPDDSWAAWSIGPNSYGAVGLVVIHNKSGTVRVVNLHGKAYNDWVAGISYWMDKDERCAFGVKYADRRRPPVSSQYLPLQ